MKKSMKRITGSLVAAAIFAATTAMSTTASASYIDGDREVDYYRFEFKANYGLGEWPPHTDPVTKRIADRNWVVSVNYVNKSQYDIRYGVLNQNDIYEPVAYEAVLRGTGNSGGQYVSNKYKGYNLCMYASQLVNAPDGTAIISRGQWSPDSPY